LYLWYNFGRVNKSVEIGLSPINPAGWRGRFPERQPERVGPSQLEKVKDKVVPSKTTLSRRQGLFYL